MTYGDHLSIVKLMAERDCYRECLDKLRSAVMGRDVTVRGMGDKQLHEVTDEAVDAVRTRLMPEGMEWPKYTDGELVRIGGCWGKDGCDTSITYIERIIFAEDGVYLDNDYNEAFYRHGERVKRPAPKVLDSEGVECNVGDAVWWVHNKTGNFRIIRIEQDGKCAIHDDDADEPCGMTVPSTELTHKRPVIDADGVEIRVGDEVWDVDGSGPFIVSGFVGEPLAVIFEIAECNDLPRKPSQLTHRAPALAADGKPLRVGQTVWEVETGDGYVVERIYSGTTEPDFPGHTVACRRPDDIVTHMFKPSQLTHQRPVLDADGVPIHEGDTVYDKGTGDRFEVDGFSYDFVVCTDIDACESDIEILPSQLTHTKPEIDTWQRIEEDKDLNPFDYCKKVGHKLWTFDNAEEFKASDLVRRCKALAGVSE